MDANTLHHRFIEPMDVLFLRGNKLFGDPGSHGESLVPPWPSVAAGALRSDLLAREGVDLAAFAAGRIEHPVLGTPARPGPFTLTGFGLARRRHDQEIESLHALPADLIAEADDIGRVAALQRLQPVDPAAGLASSAPLPLWPVLPQKSRGKPMGGCWLTQAGWAAYLAGRLPGLAEVLTTQQLWAIDERVGVGLDMAQRRAADGQLFTAQAVAFKPGVGFLASVRGAEPGRDGMLRLGGDGRGAALSVARHQPTTVDFDAIVRSGRARLVMTTPGLFPDGWQLPAMGPDLTIEWPGLKARLVCAAVARADVISGWDLAQGRPKPAEQVAPTGSVYWLDELQTTPDALRKLAAAGLWPGPDQNPQRRAEGFNRFCFAAW
ncbi:MAG: hypothetical protein RIQ53_962 [Pseudomonadota bacterium]|jgi:CRISPR-associated protein Cmr3